MYRYDSKKRAPIFLRLTTREVVLAGMFTALLTAISQISIPLPTGVPITIQIFGVALIGSVLGWKLGTLSILTYLLLGAVGLPVFSNFRGGLGMLAGVTGGYLWSWPVMSALCGIFPHTKNQALNLILRLIFALIGLCFVEIIGGLQWNLLTENTSQKAILLYSLTTFVPKDILLTAAAILFSKRIRPLIGSATTRPDSDRRQTSAR